MDGWMDIIKKSSCLSEICARAFLAEKGLGSSYHMHMVVCHVEYISFYVAQILC